MHSFSIPELVDEAISKQMDAIKRVFGTKEALIKRVEEWITYLEGKRYHKEF